MFLIGIIGLCGVSAYAYRSSGEHQDSVQTCSVEQPNNGRYARYDRSPLVVPLTITTQSGANYFIKIEDASTKRAIMTFFVEGGGTIEQKMPLGLYKLKYVSGDKWCGEQRLFGSSTTASETDTLQNFEDGYSYSVILRRMREGNLPVRSISLKDF